MSKDHSGTLLNNHCEQLKAEIMPNQFIVYISLNYKYLLYECFYWLVF
jgi:hypothetical protein